MMESQLYGLLLIVVLLIVASTSFIEN